MVGRGGGGREGHASCKEGVVMGVGRELGGREWDMVMLWEHGARGGFDDGEDLSICIVGGGGIGEEALGGLLEEELVDVAD